MNLISSLFIVILAPCLVGFFLLLLNKIRSEKKRLLMLEKMRAEFVANVSHELKTPLTSILGYAETLLHGALRDPEASDRFVKKIEQNALRLKNLTEDLLKLSEIESGNMALHIESISLRKILEEVQRYLEEALEAKHLKLTHQILSDTYVSVDPSALHQILVNLIDNAIKYTAAGGRIAITANKQEKFLKISVADTGVGIPEKDLPHVFERFYRIDKARSREVGGTGLGLSIVKHWVQAHGGEVGVTSEMGKGSEFYFSIPC